MNDYFCVVSFISELFVLINTLETPYQTFILVHILSSFTLKTASPVLLLILINKILINAPILTDQNF